MLKIVKRNPADAGLHVSGLPKTRFKRTQSVHHPDTFLTTRTGRFASIRLLTYKLLDRKVGNSRLCKTPKLCGTGRES